MNERIKELLEQATEVYDYWYRGESVCMVDHKMFAELIVRECISALDEADGSVHHRECLLEHFGVEV